MFDFVKKLIKFLLRKINKIYKICLSFFYKYFRTPFLIYFMDLTKKRNLEIGPGVNHIKGFETVNVVWTDGVDYVADASKKLPFKDGTYDIVYASHILEHIPWYQLDATLKEWVRVLNSGGFLEVWVPNGLLIAKTFVEAEEGMQHNIHKDGWYKFNSEGDACVWANGRLFSYGDGTGNKLDPNWHLATFSPRYLEKLFIKAGLKNVQFMNKNEVRGYDHGWINLGIKGQKL